MSDVSELIERLRERGGDLHMTHGESGARDCNDAADALEAQAREIADLSANLERLQQRWATRPVTDELESRLAAAERERDEAKEYGTRMRREWQRECEDTNLMLQGLGLCPSEYRSEGGSLMLGRIQHAFKKREASIVAERDEAVALIDEVDTLAVNNVTGCGTCSTIQNLTTRFLDKVKP